MTEQATPRQNPSQSKDNPAIASDGLSSIVSAQRSNSTLQNRLFRTKDPQTLVDEAYHPDRMMNKTLTAFDLVMLGIGATIGTGIFALTGTAAAGQCVGAHDWLSTPIINFLLHSPLGREGAGPALVLSFLVAAFACGLTAMCYAELAAMIPVSGSAYTFAYAALGEIIAWIIGWDLMLEYAIGNTAIAVSWSDYFLRFVHGASGARLPLWLTTDTGTAISRCTLSGPAKEVYSSTALPTLFGHAFALNIPACAIMFLITWLLVIGVKESAKVNRAIVFVNVSVILFVIGFGSMFTHPQNWVPFAPSGLAGVMGGAAIVFFAFVGFDAVSSTAEEAKNPQKDLPIGMLGSLSICTLLYVGVSLVLTGILKYTAYANDAAPVATALEATGHPWAKLLVSVGALAGMTSVILVFQLGQPRIFMAMARDGLLPKFFSTIHPKYRTPFIPTILTGIFVGVTAMFVDIGQAAELCNIGTLSAFILVCGGVLVLRKTHPERPRPFRCPASPVLPTVGILACLTLMSSLPVITWIRFVVWMTIGMVIYFSYGFRKNKEAVVQPLIKTEP